MSFLGERDDIAGVLAAVDVLVHCPIAAEPFGRSVAKAMRSRRAVSPHGAAAFPVVVDGEAGLLVVGDGPGFAAAVHGCSTRRFGTGSGPRGAGRPRACSPPRPARAVVSV